jgi:hypothetical protein
MRFKNSYQPLDVRPKLCDAVAPTFKPFDDSSAPFRLSATGLCQTLHSLIPAQKETALRRPDESFRKSMSADAWFKRFEIEGAIQTD